ncbi:hypothetical protein DFH09DRAFT_434342 [Mycena vulgaris]|nr:hypothetical protein DFH09DRAFT_434342 [Mycena vulgaris]
MLVSSPFVLASWLLLTVSAIVASPVDNAKKCDCSGTVPTDPEFHCGDARLGPVKLPKTGLLRNIVANYDRFGGLCPGAFLAKWTNRTTGAYVFPPVQGFQLSTGSLPIDGNQTLVPGMRLDRFGSEFGMFLAPAFTPFAQRALPPSSLNDPVGGPAANYHVYQVERNFTVLTGTIAAWFGQSGQGTQYLPMDNIMTLVANGFLSRVEEGKNDLED